MNNQQIEEAKQIALTLFPDIDYVRTTIHLMNPPMEKPQPASTDSVSIPIVEKDGYRLAYDKTVDYLFIGEVEFGPPPTVDEIESIIAAMKETAAYRQYIESEINLIINGQGLPLRRPIGLIDPDTMRFRE